MISNEQAAQVAAMWQAQTTIEIMQALSLTLLQVREAKTLLKLPHKRASGSGRSVTEWTDDEDALMRSEYGNREVADIAQSLGRSEQAVLHRATDLGLTKKKRAWTADEDSILLTRRDQYGDTFESISQRLGRSAYACMARHKYVKHGVGR